MNDQYLPKDPPITHAEGCWSWGPRHFMCALHEIHRLTAEIDRLKELNTAQRYAMENDSGKSSI